jgi:hypothetical protein
MRCLQIVALLLLHSAQALAHLDAHAPVPSATDKYQAWRAGAAQILARRSDAGSLATAAALGFFGAAARIKADSAPLKAAAVEWAAKASELEPENASIGWLRLQLCAGTAGCNVRDAATTMRWVDADNSAAWMPTLAAAQREKDTTEVDRILAGMAQGVRFDLYSNRTVVLLFDALKKAAGALPPKYLPSDFARLSEAIEVAGAEIIPSFTPLQNACRDSASAERREDCLKLSKLMQRSDTVTAQMAGFGMEKRLLPPDSKEARTIAEYKHVLEWRVSTASEFDVPILPWLKNARARERVAKMRALPREEDVDIAVLRQRKMPLEPPEGHP